MMSEPPKEPASIIRKSYPQVPCSTQADASDDTRKQAVSEMLRECRQHHARHPPFTYLDFLPAIPDRLELKPSENPFGSKLSGSLALPESSVSAGAGLPSSGWPA